MQTSGGYRLNCHMPCASVDGLCLAPTVPFTCRFNLESNRNHGQHYETGLLVHWLGVCHRNRKEVTTTLVTYV